MKYVAQPRVGDSCLSQETLRPNELRYMHWQCKQIAKSVAAYKAAPRQHDEHCYTRRYFLFMCEHLCEGYFWRGRGLPVPQDAKHDKIRYPLKDIRRGK